MKELRSHQKCKPEDRNWRRNGFHAAAPYSFSGPTMPTSHGHDRADFCSYFPRDWYGPRTHPPSHLRLHHVQYAAPKSPVLESFSRDCFDQKKRSGAQQEKGEVVRQVYRVKKDGRKNKSSDLNSNKGKLIKMLESSVAKGKDMKRSAFDSSNAKSEQKKLEISKAEEDLPLFTSTSRPRCPLGLSRWQKQKLLKLSAQELKERNLAWVPKKDAQVQHKGDVSAFIGKRATELNNRRRSKKKSLDQRIRSVKLSVCKYLDHHPTRWCCLG